MQIKIPELLSQEMSLCQNFWNSIYIYPNGSMILEFILEKGGLMTSHDFGKLPTGYCSGEWRMLLPFMTQYDVIGAWFEKGESNQSH